MTRDGEKLLDLFEKLGTQQQETLLAFAEILIVREGETRCAEPLRIERPAQETVVMAIRRLVRTYPMLDRRELIAEASRFMAQHALEGRPAAEVIDDLEVTFARHYRKIENRN